MMTFFSIVAVVVIFAIISNLRGRIQRLEALVQNQSVQKVTDQQTQIQQSTITSETSSDVPQTLLVYIQQQMQVGISREVITQVLLNNGWHRDQIEQAFQQTKNVITQNHIQEEVDTTPDMFDALATWFKEDWLMKLGALLLIIGFGWLTTYAFLNNWIGPMGRITLGISFGIIFMIIGWVRIRKFVNQGGVFLVLGSTTILVTVFAARTLYDFFDPLTALVVMFLSTACVAIISVRHNTRILAVLSLLMAGIAPLLTKPPESNYIILFSYLLIVIIGAIWIVFITGAHELTMLSLLIIFAYSAPHLLSPTSFPLVQNGTLLYFAYGFAILFFITNTIGILKNKDEDISLDLITASGNGLFLLMWITQVVPKQWQSLVIVFWMLVFTVGAFLLFRKTNKKESFYVYAGVCIVMLATATAVELSGPALVIAYIIECTLITLSTYLIMRNVQTALYTTLLFIGPMVLSFKSIFSNAWLYGIIHNDFFVLGIFSSVLLGLGLFFSDHTKDDTESSSWNTVLVTIGSLYVYILLWLSLKAGIQNTNTAILISLIIYTIIGLILYFYGLAHNKKSIRLHGAILVGFVVLRLLFVDVWRMEIAGRIVVFFAIGALLISTAFLRKKK